MVDRGKQGDGSEDVALGEGVVGERAWHMVCGCGIGLMGERVWHGLLEWGKLSDVVEWSNQE